MIDAIQAANEEPMRRAEAVWWTERRYTHRRHREVFKGRIECLTKGMRPYILGRAVEHGTIYCVCGRLDRALPGCWAAPSPAEPGAEAGA